MLAKTEAIVLKSMKYRDTSKIVTFYTKEFGKIKGIAKGARTAKNKFGASLEPISHSMLVFYKKEHRDLHLISQCDVLNTHRLIAKDLNCLSHALAMLELVNTITHHEEKNFLLFDLILESLQALNDAKIQYDTLFHAFSLRLVTIFGFHPNFEFCATCHRMIDENMTSKQFTFEIPRGAILCDQCRLPSVFGTHLQHENIHSIALSIQCIKIIKRMMNASLSSLTNIKYDEQVGNEIGALLRLYLRYHFDGLKSLKSAEIIQHLQRIN